MSKGTTGDPGLHLVSLLVKLVITLHYAQTHFPAIEVHITICLLPNYAACIHAAWGQLRKNVT